MTTTPILAPRVLGQAENAHRAMLDRILVKTGGSYYAWVALTLAATGGRAVEPDPLVVRMMSALRIDRATALATITELASSGLIEALPGEENRIQLTEAGRARYLETRAVIDDVMGRVYDEIPADDLATVGRVLALITARMNGELDGYSEMD
jgi:DNA-binding MarR family transcriptional regulator